MISKEWYQEKAKEYYFGYYEAIEQGDKARAELCDKWYKQYSKAGMK